MDCLEFRNLQQLIYTDLANNIGECKDEDEVQPTVEFIHASLDSHSTNSNEKSSKISEDVQRIYMPASRANCHIGFAQVAASLPEPHVESVVPVLIEVLRDIPRMDFDQCLVWDDWAIPDQLVYNTVSSLLRLASAHPEHRIPVTDVILDFTSKIVTLLQNEHPCIVLSQYAPAFHGFYRAIISSPFPWSVSEWSKLTSHLGNLFAPDVVDRLNNLFPEALQLVAEDEDEAHFLRVFLARYVLRDRPLNGYFLICCIMETIWTVLAQTFDFPLTTNLDAIPNIDGEAAAANRAWMRLMKRPILEMDVSGRTEEYLNEVIKQAMRCYLDLLMQLEDMDTEPSLDTYAWETMSESLKLASVCSVALQELDDELFTQIKRLLSEDSPVIDHLVQEAALKSTTILVQNFQDIAPTMAAHLRKFVTSPLPMFEFEFATETRAPPPLAAAAKCLAQCIKLSPGDDFVLSNMYSLLNYISATASATSKDSNDAFFAVAASLLGAEDASSNQSYYASTVQTVQTGLQALSEDQRRLIGISTISVVARLAVEFNEEQVTVLTVSMLLQRLRSAEPSVEAAIVYNLVDLAVISPENTFSDIIKAFSMINRSANPGDQRFSNNTVVAAQTRLAQELRRRPEYYDTYLVELLGLFIDKAVAIQNSSIGNQQRTNADVLIEQLGALVLPIDALLAHSNFNPHVNASPELVALFRNLWFLCVLFRFTTIDEGGSATGDWQVAALSRIATKTPALVVEEIPDFLTSHLEYNTIIRQEYAATATARHKALLLKSIPARSSELRGLLPSQVIFLVTMLELESMRSACGLPASLPTYFVNESVNGSTALSLCMESVADKVMQVAIGELGNQVVEHSLPERIYEELQGLLKASCHRVAKCRDTAARYLNRLISSFPSLMCDPPLVFAILEVLTMVRKACEGEYTDEFDPLYEFHSEVSGITLHLTDSYKSRNDLLARLYRDANTWFSLALARAPIEFQATLQKYLASNEGVALANTVELGASVALQFACAISPAERKQVPTSGPTFWVPDRSRMVASQMVTKERFSGEPRRNYHYHRRTQSDDSFIRNDSKPLRKEAEKILKGVHDKSSNLTLTELKEFLFRCAAALVYGKQCNHDLLHYLVALPFAVFGPLVISAGIDVWTWVIGERPEFEIALMMEINTAVMATIRNRSGLFSDSVDYTSPFVHEIKYNPTDKSTIDRGTMLARKLLSPHLLILQMLLSRFQAARYRKPGLMLVLLRLVLRTATAHRLMSTHPLAREARFSFLLFGFETLKSSRMDAYCEHSLREALYSAAFSWFSVPAQWSYGTNRVQIEADIKILTDFLSLLQSDAVRGSHLLSISSPSLLAHRKHEYITRLKDMNQLLRLLVDNELHRLAVWDNPANDVKRGIDHFGQAERGMVEDTWLEIIRTAWRVDPTIVVHLPQRFKHATVEREAGRWIRAHSHQVIDCPVALRFVVGDKVDKTLPRDLKFVLLWDPIPPITAVSFFEVRYANEPVLLQYAHRVLEELPVNVTFFFVPQIVQSLRNDRLGYVKRFIFETAKISQLFCHQIIWNMKANCYRDDAATIEDPMKPELERMTELVVNALSGIAKDFYDKEFGFFEEVTSISGKLKPFIKKTKPEKKAKIDEEMAKIKVEVGVYLPSNPDGVVVDIDRKSGRPLQSHAKAPFMASFKVRKEHMVINADPESVLDEGDGHEEREQYEIWQAAIFKVGDDCRQDMLALQVIAMFKNIYTTIGLNLYLFPYRVTATGPGCGVIDVVPNATSRDEMGRAKVNDLLGFFYSKYGGEDSIAFQKARLNFIQSMAAYSVACYILQIKDRHNGNIMIDGEGHIVHVDFGFLFDIDKCLTFSCNGIKFEPNSFKLNHEMVVLMGGRYSQGYSLFQQLTIKAFLAIRPHADEIISTVSLMLGTELPSFKGEGTIRRLRDRFALGLNERQAADFMIGIIKNAHENKRSIAYDEFQRFQNGIPYN